MIKKSLYIVLLCLSVLMFAGCGSGGGGGGDSVTTTTSNADNDSISSVVGSSGGNLTTPSGDVSLDIPAGALMQIHL